MLSKEDTNWLINTLDIVAVRAGLSEHDKAELKRIAQEATKPLELLIFCPVCKVQHVDEVEYAEPHKRHACQNCGLLFSVTKDMPNIGVRFFKGCRNTAT